MPGTFDKTNPELGLKASDLTADRPVGHTKIGGGPDHGAGAGEGFERPQADQGEEAHDELM